MTRADGKSRMDMLDWQAEGWQLSEAPSCSRPAPATLDGPTSSPPRRRLNPLFVEWLMGWPTGLSGFDTAATASCRSPQPSPGCDCMDCWLTMQREALAMLLDVPTADQGTLL